MRRAAALLVAIAAALNAAPAAAAPPPWQPVAKIAGIFDVAGPPHGEGHLAFIVTIQKVDSSPSALPTPSPTPAPKPAPHSPAATVALIVTLAVLGAGALAVVRARWGSPGSGSAPPSP